MSLLLTWAMSAENLQVQRALKDIIGNQAVSSYADIIDPDEIIIWHIYLPENDSDAAPGVFVYVSPMPTAKLPHGWKSVFDKHNMIYIAAEHSGNQQPANRRILLAIQALSVVKQVTRFDPVQTVISGFSGGGRIASMVATQYPDLFTAGLYICGVNIWNTAATTDVSEFKQHRFVFLTGSHDFNRHETNQIHTEYIKAGISNSRMIVMPNAGHQLPDARYLQVSLDYLLTSPES